MRGGHRIIGDCSSRACEIPTRTRLLATASRRRKSHPPSLSGDDKTPRASKGDVVDGLSRTYTASVTSSVWDYQ